MISTSSLASAREPAFRDRVAGFLELGKARLSALVLMTTLIGFFLGSPAAFDWRAAIVAMVGTGLAALGANALNQCIEHERDARMLRTRKRPLPSGLLTLREAWAFAISASVLGPAILAIGVNSLSGFLAALCLLIYVLAYTPMKTRSPLNTLVGAVTGAIPPMVGWAAAAEEISAGAWILGAILFIWQIPHFLALAWLYREDYERGGFKMLPSCDPDGGITCQAVLLHSLALIPATLMLSFAGVTSAVFAAGALALGLGFVALAARLYRERTSANARKVFLASVIYLPILIGLMAVDRHPARTAFRAGATAEIATAIASR